MAVSNDELLALARELPIPVPWDREEFIANIAAVRGRPIRCADRYGSAGRRSLRAVAGQR